MRKARKIFFVVASGGENTDRHYLDTIERKKSLSEIKNFLTSPDVEILEKRYHGGPFAAWGAKPGLGNIRNWESMEPGDYVLVYKSKKIIFAAEVALKTRNPQLAEKFWGREEDGNTWEYMYFLINSEAVNVDMSRLNIYLGYKESYFPQGFMAIEQSKTDALLNKYGDILSSLRRIEAGKDLEQVAQINQQQEQIMEERIERPTTEHDEMQWRLIRLGRKTKVDVWVPRNDQGKSFEGHNFREDVLKDFQETLDVPTYIKNIDVVWKYGYSIKSAFEIENSTSVYSGILRLSDLRALTPNSSYPLFIVADRSRKNKVFSELRRPTFDNPFLNMRNAVSYLSYDKIRELDEQTKNVHDSNISLEFLINQSEKVN